MTEPKPPGTQIQLEELLLLLGEKTVVIFKLEQELRRRDQQADEMAAEGKHWSSYIHHAILSLL